MKQYDILRDLNGKEVKADEISRTLIEHFEKGLFGTLRNEAFTFWADVECHSKRGNVYTFISTTYGHAFVVNFNDNTVKIRR